MSEAHPYDMAIGLWSPSGVRPGCRFDYAAATGTAIIRLTSQNRAEKLLDSFLSVPAQSGFEPRLKLHPLGKFSTTLTALHLL